MSTFKERMQKKSTNVNKLVENATGKKGFQKDERFWELTRDKNKNHFGEAVIRFLPGCEGEEDSPIVSYKQYFIDTPKGKFIAEAPENAGLPSFPAEVVNDLWKKYTKTKDEQYKELFKKRIATEKGICNILVVKDPANPENEGKVFLFKIGRYINKLIFKEMGTDLDGKGGDKPKSSLMEIEEKEPYNPMDLWEGANFYISCVSDTGKEINISYEKSRFMGKSPVADTDEEIEKIYKQQYSLQEFVNPERYTESYKDMRKRYIDMTGDYYDIFPEKYNEEGKSKVSESFSPPEEDTSPLISRSKENEEADIGESYEDILGSTKGETSVSNNTTSNDVDMEYYLKVLEGE